MNAKRLLFLLILVLSAICGHAQYSIDRFTIAGGGGTSTGGTLAVSGTFGQPVADAPASTGGAFTLLGGFWPLFAVQTPGAPPLTITFNPQIPGVIIAWPSPSTRFVLQEIADLNEYSWVGVVQPVSDNGTNKFIVITNPPSAKRFYRLFRP